MRITKFGHACVRIETVEGTVLIDPGMFVTPEVFDGVDAILITHEHVDHYVPELLQATQTPVFTIDAVARKIAEQAPDVAERTTVVSPGEHFAAGGLGIRAEGKLHEVIHPDLPRFFNCGYLIDAAGTSVFHPGDALTGTDLAVDVLFVPVSAPWARSADLIDFARRVGARRNVAIHDRIYSDVGSGIFDNQMNMLLHGSQSYIRLADGADLALSPDSL